MAAENALASQSRKHPHGWGIGWFVDDEAYVVKSGEAAHSCDRFHQASSRLTSHTFLVHVRRATVGNIDHVNAHPFRFGRWLFCHNGTIFGFDQLRPWILDRIAPKNRALIVGDTDSEHLFHLILTRLQDEGVDVTGRSEADEELVSRTVRSTLIELDELARTLGVERPILNVLLTDGRTLIAHRAGMPLFLATQKRHCADFHTCTEPSKVCMMAKRPKGTPVNHLLIASEKIGVDENVWEDIADGTTVVLDRTFQLTEILPPSQWNAPVLPERYRVPLEPPS